MLDESPIDYIKKPKLTKPLPVALSDEQIEKLIEYCLRYKKSDSRSEFKKMR